jgi:hypothetical protein
MELWDKILYNIIRRYTSRLALHTLRLPLTDMTTCFFLASDDTGTTGLSTVLSVVGEVVGEAVFASRRYSRSPIRRSNSSELILKGPISYLQGVKEWKGKV